MFFTNTDNSFHLLSVIDLELPSQETTIPPRPFHILSLRLRGCASLETPSASIHLEDNDLLYVPSGCSYRIQSDNERLILINFTMSDNQVSQIQRFTPINPSVFQDSFGTLHEVWTLKRTGYYFRAMSILYKILEHMNRQFSPTSALSSMRDIKESLNYLHLHFTDPYLTVAKLCSISNLSDTQFRKKFFNIYGTTPLAYINTLRINYATDLLTSTTFSVEEIALASGFSDSKYFSTVFKKYKNSAPSSFRKLN